MVQRSIISETTWKLVKSMTNKGWSPKTIEAHFDFRISAAQVRAKLRRWKRDSYFTDAKYQSPAYKKWRMAVLQRDGNKCIICKRGKPKVKALQADHIKSWSRYPELRFEVSNGRTLCLYHHRRTLNYGRKANTCNDELNGKVWEIKERILWKKKQQEKLLKQKSQ